MAGSLDIGTLQGGVEFEDKVSTTLDILVRKTEGLEAAFGGLNHGVRDAAAGFAIAETAMKALERVFDIAVDLVKDFTTEGAAIADVTDNFNAVTEAAGRTGETLLGALREGTHNTIDDFALMKIANQDLAAGLNMTDEQFKRMATGANALAQATGGSVADALEKVNEALLKGQARGVQTLTGVIDMEAAQLKYAESLGTTVERLSEEEKLQANREAILDAVTAATARLGEQTDGVDEILAQISTSWSNFYDKLISSVAASPKVIQAFSDIRDTLMAAFGGESQSVIDTFVGVVESVAEKVSEYLPTVLEWFGKAKDAAIALWGGAVDAWGTYGPMVLGALSTVVDWIRKVYDTVMTTWNALPDWLKTIAERSAATAVGLYALDAAGSAVGLSFSDIVGYAGNLTTTLTGLPTILKNVSAGFETLIALKAALDFSTFANAGASVSLVGEAIYGMIGPLGIAIGYAAALYAAFELGKWEPISDFWQDLGLRFQGFNAAQREAMIAQDHLTQKMEAAGKVKKEENDLSEKTKKIQEDVAAAIGQAQVATEGHTGAVKANNDALRMSEDELKRYKQAWIDIEGAGKNAQATIDQLDGKVVEAVRYYYEAGISMEKLKIAYQLTDEQAGALKDKFDAHTKALADQKEKVDAVAKAWANLNDLGADQEKITRGIGDVVKDNIVKYADLGASVSDLAKAYGLTETQIRAIISIRDREREATENQTDAHAKQNAGLEQQVEMYQALNGEMMTLEEHKKRMSQGNSITYDLSTQEGLDFYKQMNTGATMGSDKDILAAAKKGASLQQLIQSGLINPYGAWGGENRIPGFSEGGAGDFGSGTLAMLHGPEAIIPLDKMGTMGANVTIYVNGTAEDVARKVSHEIMRGLKSGRQFGAA